MKPFAKHSLQGLIRYRIIIIWVLILFFLGITLWRTLALSQPENNQEYAQTRRTELQAQATTIELDEQLRAQIDGLRETPIDVTPQNLGTRDPFNP